MQVTVSWTGGRADALRKSLHMSNESFAEYLGVGARTVANWRLNPHVIPKLGMQGFLDTALERASDQAKEQFIALISEMSIRDGTDSNSVPHQRIPTSSARESVQLLRGGHSSSPGPGPVTGWQGDRQPASSQAGLDSGSVAEEASWSSDLERSVSLLDRMVAGDLADGPMARLGWAPTAVPGLITGFLFSGQTWQEGQEQGGLVVPSPGSGLAAAGRIRAFTHSLMNLDFQYGGGHVRRVLLFYFQSEIVPLLRADHPERVRRELFSAAAEVTELLGWSAYDAGRHGAAQRYYAQGLRLAGEAADPVLGARLLSSLSHQANYLGKFRDALQLARAAQSVAAGRTTAKVRSMFLAYEARALASLGDQAGCAAVLHRAERQLDQGASGHDPQWIYYFDELEFMGEAAHCARDLGQSRETREFAARALDPEATPQRTAAFISLVSAAGELKDGNLDEAIALATGAVELAGTLQSARSLRYVTDFHSALTEGKHATDPRVRQFTSLVSMAYPDLLLKGAPPTGSDLAAQRRDPGGNLVRDLA